MSKAESVIFFDVIFIMLLSAYGFSTSTGASFNSFQTLPSPTLAPLPGQIKCNPIDFICAGTKDVATATAYVGWAIVNAPVLIVYFLLIIVDFSDIVLSIAFAPNLSVNGIPYFGLLFFALQTYVIFEGIRIFRGSSSGV